MTVIDQVQNEIAACVETLARRFGSTADAAEKDIIGEAMSDLIAELRLLQQAALLQAAKSLASTLQILERAVAAARLGPFDGYLAALESHLTKLNRLSGKAHAGESLESAPLAATTISRPSRKKTKPKKSKGARKKTRRTVPSAPEPAAPESAPAPLLTSTVFADLREEYQRLYDSCVIRPECMSNVAYYLMRLNQGQPSYRLVEQQIKVPWSFVGIIHGMECGFNFAGHLHNGDKLTARTVQIPKGRPLAGEPPFTWLDSALDALRLRKLDLVTDWSVPRMLHLLEGYNGFGYRRRGLPSPYLWSFSNHYEKGKFVADGHFDPEAVSKQCGAALMLKKVLGA